jgi:hypothetical protein
MKAVVLTPSSAASSASMTTPMTMGMLHAATLAVGERYPQSANRLNRPPVGQPPTRSFGVRALMPPGGGGFVALGLLVKQQQA